MTPTRVLSLGQWGVTPFFEPSGVPNPSRGFFFAVRQSRSGCIQSDIITLSKRWLTQLLLIFLHHNFSACAEFLARPDFSKRIYFLYLSILAFHRVKRVNFA